MDYNNGVYNPPNNNFAFGGQIYHDNGGVSNINLGILHPVGIEDNTEAVLGLTLTVDEKLKKCFIPPTDNKAIKFDALSLQIGKWKFESMRGSDLVCKGNFNKRYFAWEVFDGTLKNKIQFDFSSIDDLKYNLSPNKSYVTFKLKQSPSFSVELPPEIKKHTKWKTHHDFTDNEASSLHLHVLELKTTVLEKYWKYFMMAHPTVFYNLFYNVAEDNQNEAMLRQIDYDPLPKPSLEAFTSGVGCPPINGYVQEGALREDGANYMDNLDDQTINAISQFNLPHAPSRIDNPQQPLSSFAGNYYDINQNDAMCNHYVPDVARVTDGPRQLPSSSVDEASSSGGGRSRGNGYLLNHVVENTNGYYSQPSYHHFFNWDNN